MKLKYSVICLIAFMSVFLSGTKAYCEQKTPYFSDIKGSFAEDSINKLFEMGIIKGVESKEFCPTQNLNRYDFAVIIAKTLGIQPIFPLEPTFSDIPSGTVETGYVEAIFKLGLIKGLDKTHFGANQLLLRQDAAVILHRAMAEENELLSFNGKYIDTDQIAPYAQKAVAYVTYKGWMTGSENCFYPSRQITRAEASVLAYRLFKIRKGQATTAISNISSEKVRIRTNATYQPKQRNSKKPLSFTTSYGMDNQAVSSITPDGILLSGKEAGSGLITVNAGNNKYSVLTEVYSPKTKVTKDVQKNMTGDLITEQADISTYTVEQEEPDPVYQQLEQKSYPGPVEGINSESDTWTGFLRQKKRDITVDLKMVGSVSNISMEFNRDENSGIYWPDYLQCSVSLDGVGWYELGYAYRGANTDTTKQNITLALSFPTVNARYIRISFPVELWVFARHLSIKGGMPAVKPAILAHAVPKNINTTSPYLQVPGCKDILLIYTGNNSEKADWTTGDFLPVVAYMDENRRIKGRMFDTMLFLPYMFEITCTKDDWNAYIEDLFTPEKQLSALNVSVGQINEITGLQEKEKVILSLPYPDINQQDFGQLEKGAPSLSFSEAQLGKDQSEKNRFAALEWYYYKLMDKWEKAGFNNLELVGIYWYEESVDHHNILSEKALVQKTARLIHDHKQKFFWIPYYGALGFEDWKSFGFDYAFIQPSYYNKEHPPLERMDKAADLARKYNMGIEIEFDDEILNEASFNELLHKQLDKAHQLGLDTQNTTRAYYMGLRSIVTCSRSNLPQARATYDDLYKWLNGNYQ